MRTLAVVTCHILAFGCSLLFGDVNAVAADGSASVVAHGLVDDGQQSTGGASDEDARQAAARDLFEEGLRKADARAWAPAADRFERARAMRASPEITYNLASALVHLDKLVRASMLLHEVSNDPRSPVPVRQAASARLADLHPRLAFLTVEGPRAGNVFVDGNAVDDARVGTAIPVDPARHVVELRQGGLAIATRAIVLHEGERRTLSFVTPELKGAPTLIAEDRASATSNPMVVRDNGSHSHPWIWVVAGVVAAGVTAGIIAARSGGASAPSGNVDTWHLGAQ